jgi:hypothetical protein
VSSSDYGFAARLLHRVALASPAILRATMQMEDGRLGLAPFDGHAVAPVFICGLARSGSTLLLNSLTATGAFSTSTYRHMPFVLAPSMWSGASGRHRTGAVAAERAHGDGMQHSVDSEEAFEEVFWRAVNGNPKGASLPWNAPVSAEVQHQFRRFIQSVVKAGAAPRYLSKNNNNVARIPALLKAVPTARIVIPFRDPVGFAGSTLAQHARFLDEAQRDPFAADYMAWLGHHEFGPRFKPFAAPGVSAPDDVRSGVTAKYLVAYWRAVYSAVAAYDDPRIVLFDYDGFCQAPTAHMASLGAALALDTAPEPPPEVHAPRQRALDGLDADVLAEARSLHAGLTRRSVVWPRKVA